MITEIHGGDDSDQCVEVFLPRICHPAENSYTEPHIEVVLTESGSDIQTKDSRKRQWKPLLKLNLKKKKRRLLDGFEKLDANNGQYVSLFGGGKAEQRLSTSDETPGESKSSRAWTALNNKSIVGSEQFSFSRSQKYGDERSIGFKKLDANNGQHFSLFGGGKAEQRFSSSDETLGESKSSRAWTALKNNSIVGREQFSFSRSQKYGDERSISLREKKRILSVTFSTIQVREYSLTIGDRRKIGLTLDWTHTPEVTSIISPENGSLKLRHQDPRHPRKLTYIERYTRLQEASDLTEAELAQIKFVVVQYARRRVMRRELQQNNILTASIKKKLENNFPTTETALENNVSKQMRAIYSDLTNLTIHK